MSEKPISSRKYTYIHDEDDTGFQSIDSHHIMVPKSRSRQFLLYSSFLVLMAHVCSLLLGKEEWRIVFPWNSLTFVILAAALHLRSIEKESVLIMPTFGVQLETHYRSGRICRRFIPISKILKPVLNECVTPTTCYWSLVLILRGDKELTLVFQELQPPLEMLVSVWKALCTAVDGDTTTDCDGILGDKHFATRTAVSDSAG
ncbi:uncharacterized protein LOC18445525 isoform X2 [Amborella trichopoda]|uniref:uncharacterized protein LOC18445525 isoform X2 n=1 Tax=Amborella trichopoda TaxID=13333 RepID=UPI0009BDCFC5|nr:uncharacterized protein LOC18445525 isoform X2 [Amborella trichopoda]|eukprot:XP_006855724.2 uncharacterized protein LOC18445525 isoform X2 [Amborella trichopoda]